MRDMDPEARVVKELLLRFVKGFISVAVHIAFSLHTYTHRHLQKCCKGGTCGMRCSVHTSRRFPLACYTLLSPNLSTFFSFALFFYISSYVILYF